MPEQSNPAATPAFRYFWLEDRNPVSGRRKRRHIGAPNEAMTQVHAALIRKIRSLPVNMVAATGALPGCNPVRNVYRHRDNQYFYLIDLSDAYNTVDRERLITLLARVQPDADPADIATFLDRYCLNDQGGLITGAPSSPDLFNLYAALLLDAPLSLLCDRYRLTYTRYLDDLTFSANARIGCKKREAIRAVIAGSGLVIQHRKCEVADITKRPVVITGVGLDAGGFLFLPRGYLRKLRGLLHRAIYRGDVPQHVVEGSMGVFKSITRRRAPNRTELTILVLYHHYRKCLAVG